MKPTLALKSVAGKQKHPAVLIAESSPVESCRAKPAIVDAKFRVHALTDVGLAAGNKDADDEKAAERAGSFKRADVWKMHAYRDAIPDARSVWILYPGGQFRFFGVPGGEGPSGCRAASSPEGLPEELKGVGAIPVAPVGGGEGHGRGMAAASVGVLRATLGRMLPG